MHVVVLGPVAAERSDGDAIPLGPRLQRLLAALVIDRGSVVSVDRLADAVWQGSPPDGADGTLRSYVTRLRQALELESKTLVRRRTGYVLDIPDSSIDAARFEDELVTGLHRLRAGDLGDADALLTTALGRWRGRPFGDLGEENWARAERARLEERRFAARRAHIEVMFADGRTDVAIAAARALGDEQPLREHPRELLMRALYASGAKAEALRVFTEFRAHLLEETGLDPSAELADLQRRVLPDETSVGSIGGRLRGYELGKHIGTGRLGAVRRATQPGLGRDVAIKIIRSELADHPALVRGFEHEARLVARVEHPHVVPLYDFWREPGAAYLVMRLMTGGSVGDAVRRTGPRSVTQLVTILDEIGGALAEAHRLGVHHRDVRPDNLLLDGAGRSYLSDFGIGRSATTELAAAGIQIVDPHYAAPETLRGDPGGVPADVLSLAISSFEMLTGTRPFADTTDLDAVVRRQTTGPLPSVRTFHPDLPTAVDDVLAVATSRVAADRHQSIEQFVDDLSGALTRASLSSRRPRMPVRNPYVGLHAFDETDADRFFGRERIVGELVDAVRRQPLVVVVGPSGSGKSSLVRAGLLPAIRNGAVPGSDRWLVTTMTPGADPVAAFGAALLSVAVEPPAALHDHVRQPGGLLRAVRRVAPTGDRLLLVIDQFEEMFIHAGEPLRRTFLDELADAVTAEGSPLSIVATLRADHYDAPLRHASIATVMRAGTVPVQPMTPDELRRAVVEPARRAGVEVEQSLAAELVAQVSAEPSTLPLLQFSLTELFERRTADVMQHESHSEIGGLTGSIAARADRILAAGDDADVAVVRRMFFRLITLERSGSPRARRSPRAEIVRDERSAWLLDAFIAGRLLTIDADPSTREPVVSLAHEALIDEWPCLRAWVDEDNDDLRTVADVGRRTAAWLAADRDDGELARGSRLTVVEDLAARRRELLTAEEVSWISTSGAEERRRAGDAAAVAERDRRQNRRLRRLVACGGVLLVLTIVAAAVALGARDRAEDSAEAAEIERLIALSASQVDNRPDLAILLALEAHRRALDRSTLSSVHRAIAVEPRIVSLYDVPSDAHLARDGSVGLVETTGENGAAVEFIRGEDGTALGPAVPIGSGVRLAVVADDGRTAALYLGDNTVRFATRGSPTLGARHELGVLGLYDLALDAGGGTAMLVAGNTVQLVDVRSGTVIASRPMDVPPEEGFRIRATMSPDGDRVAVLVASDASLSPERYDVTILDTASLESTEHFTAAGSLVHALFLDDDGRLVVGHDDGVVRVYDDDRAASIELRGHLGPVRSLAVNGYGDIASAADDGTVRAWSADDAAATMEFEWAGSPYSLGLDARGTLTIASVDQPVVVVRRLPAALSLDEYRSDGTIVVDALLPFFAEVTPGGDTLLIRSLDDGSTWSSLTASDAGIGTWPPQVFTSAGGEWVLALSRNETSTFDKVVTFRSTDAEDRHVIDYADIPRALGVANFLQARVSMRPDASGERLLALVTDETDASAVAWLSLPDLEVLAGPVEIDTFGALIMLSDGRAVVAGNGQLVVLPAGLDDEPATVELDAALTAHAVADDDRVVLVSDSGDMVLFDPNDSSLDTVAVGAAEGFVTDATVSPDGSTVAISFFGGTVQLVDIDNGDTVGVPSQVGGGAPTSEPGVRWARDGSGVWYSSGDAPVLVASDPSSWPGIACGIVHRELTVEEWHRFVDPGSDPVPSCD